MIGRPPMPLRRVLPLLSFVLLLLTAWAAPAASQANSVVGVAKNMTVIGVNPYVVRMDFYCENFGDTVIGQLSMMDDLDAVFGRRNYTLLGPPVRVNGPSTFTVNSAYNGRSDQELLGGGSFQPGEIAHVRMDVQVATSGVYTNQVKFEGFDPFGNKPDDVSASGMDPDPNGDGEPNEKSKTTVRLLNPVIGVAKSMTATGTGPWDVTLDLYFENFGDVRILNLSLLEDLDSVFGAGNYTLTSAPALISGPASVSLNTFYDGTATNPEVLGGGSMRPGAQAHVQMMLQVTAPGSYVNQVRLNGRTSSHVAVSDLSTDGTDPDGTDGDNNPDESEPTILDLGVASIGVAKTMSATPTVPAAVTVDLYFENFGDLPVGGLSLLEDLDTVFGAGNYSLFSGPTALSGPASFTVNGAFDGAGNAELLGGGSLAPGETAQVRFVVQVNTAGTYTNQVTVNGTTPGGIPASDLSTDGTDPDGTDNDGNPDESDPTVVVVAQPETGVIGVAKAMSATGTGPFAVTVDLYFENFGNVAISSLSLLEDLDGVFGAGNYALTGGPTVVSGPGTFTVNGAFDGSATTELLGGGSLGVGETAQVQLLLDVTAAGTYTNQVTVNGLTPLGSPVSDVSTDGTDPDGTDNDGNPDESDPTVLTLPPGENGVIGVAKAMSATGTGPFAVTVDLYFENFGNVAISSLSLLEDLDGVFGAGNYALTGGPTVVSGPGTFTVNGAFDGSATTELLGGGSLGVGETAQVQLLLDVTAAGTYTNQVTVNGLTPLGSPVSDVSTDGTDPDGTDNDGNPDESDPTVLTLPPGENGVIGVAKAMSATGTGPFAVTVDLYFENFGNVAISSLSLLEDLDGVFGAGNYALTGGPTVVSGPGTFTVNGAFDGSATTELLGGSLGVGETAQVQLLLDVTAAGTYTNQVTVNGLTPLGSPVSDVSTDGTDPDGTDNDGNPDESDPTVLTLPPAITGVIGVAKNMTPIAATPHGAVIDLYVENFGPATLVNLSLPENLDTAFGFGNWSLIGLPSVVSGPASFTLNPAYDGAGEPDLLAGGSLLAGETAHITLTVRVLSAGTYSNQVTVSGETPGGSPVSDLSTAGTDPDGTDNDGNPDESDPTLVTFDMPGIGLAKDAALIGQNPFVVRFEFNLRNTGDVDLREVLLQDDLDATFGAGNYTVPGPPRILLDPANGLQVNAAFDGSSDINLLRPASTLPEADGLDRARIALDVVVLSEGVYSNVANTAARTDLNQVFDASTAGTDPDPDGNQDPTDNSEPTTVEVLGVELVLQKDTPVATVAPGDLVPWNLTVENAAAVAIGGVDIVDTPPAGLTYVTGSARVVREGPDGTLGTADDVRMPVAPVTTSPLRISSLGFAPGERLRIEYVLRVGAGVQPGELTNAALAYLNGQPISNTASASVEVEEDPLFDRAMLLGKVFADQDGDGWQDSGEPGIPGARLVTATGLLIETDEFGRFHLDDIDAGFAERPREFILKLDPQSLPPGSRITTENPRVLPITAAVVNRTTFGVALPESATPRAIVDEGTLTLQRGASHRVLTWTETTPPVRTVVLDHVTFETNRAVLRPAAMATLRELAASVLADPTATVEITGHTDIRRITRAPFDDNYHLSLERAKSVARALKEMGVAGSRIEASGLGPDEPVADGMSPEALQANRRVEITMHSTAGRGEIVPAPEMVEHRVRLTSDGAVAPGDVVVEDFLPDGLRYLPGSAAVNGKAVANPETRRVNGGVTLRWTVRGLGATDSAVLTYHSRVEADAGLQSFRMATRLPKTARPGGDGDVDAAWTIEVLRDTRDEGRRPQVAEYAIPFAEKSVELTPGAVDRLRAIAKDARAAGAVKVEVVGTADRAELVEGQKPDARDLSEGRANAVRRLLQETLGLDTSLVTARGAGVPSDALRGAGGDVRIAIQTVRSALAGGTAGTGAIPGDGTRLVFPLRDASGDAGTRIGPGAGTVELPGGGTMHIVQDAVAASPRLDLLAPEVVRLEGGRVAGPVPFYADVNYGALLTAWELEIREEQDPEGSRPLAWRSGLAEEIGSIVWDGVTDRPYRFTDGERVIAVLTVRDGAGRADRAMPRFIVLSQAGGEPVSAERLAELAPGVDNAQARTVPVNGTRVRIAGKLPSGSRLSVGGRPVSVDPDGAYALEEILPPGLSEQPVRVETGGEVTEFPLAVQVEGGSNHFLVGIADVTIGKNEVSGAGAGLLSDPRFDGDLFKQGRLAFYLRERLGERGQFVAHLDTHEEELENIFKNLDRKDPRRAFRQLDPDRFHLNYGDGSTVTPDVDTQGRFYGRLQWDHSRAMWGNYATGITGTEFAEFNRTLYGGLLDVRTNAATSYQEPRIEAKGFASESETAFSHDEFTGTGGSLYYLRHQDIVQGSEKVWIEIRDRDSDRVVERQTLLRGRDYEFDDIQGRVILSRPLLQIADQVSPSIVKDEPLDGNRARLMVDYEYLPARTSDADWVYGGRAKAWVVDGVAVGGTIVQEERAGNDYGLLGADVTLRGGAGTYLKGEWAETDATQASSALLSGDGGFSFQDLDADAANADRSGEATNAEARLDLADFSRVNLEIAGWWKDRDAGFSTARIGTGVETQDYGAELRWRTRMVTVSGRWATQEKEALSTTDRISGQVDFRPFSFLQLGAEIRRLETEPAGGASVEDMVGGARLGVDVLDGLNVYVAGQTTLESDGPDESLGTVGFRARVAETLALRAEGSQGDAGNAVRAGVDLDVSPSHALYGTYTLSTDRADDAAGSITVGQRKSLGHQLSVFTENRFLHRDRQAGIGHVYGLSFRPDVRWTVSATYEQSDLDDAGSGTFDRRAVSAGLGYRGARFGWRGTGEFRDDNGAVEREQWLTTQRADLEFSDSVTLLGKFNFSFTEREDFPDDARFLETGLGLAFRPVTHDRLQILAKHTFLYDLASIGQIPGGVDQRSHVFAGDVLYDIVRGFEIGGRFGHRRGELRESRDAGEWYVSRENLAGARLRYHLVRQWDAIGEYRWRWVEEAEDLHQGALVGLYRHLGGHLKLGGGYNFSDFSDDLTNLDYDHHGWFVKAIGKF